MPRLLLDAGPLVAFIMCALRPELAGNHRRVKSYTPEMIEKLHGIVSSATGHVSLPNVLTEASNHLGSGEQQAVEGAAAALAHYITMLDEIYEASIDVVRQKEYASMGLADTAIFRLWPLFVREGTRIVTQDAELAGRLSQKGVDCVNVMNWRTPGRYLD